VAAHFGWDFSYISKLATGRQVPGLPNAIRIERETGIPVEAWVPRELANSDRADGPDGTETQLAQGVKRHA
jgi:hypothetical protein